MKRLEMWVAVLTREGTYDLVIGAESEKALKARVRMLWTTDGISDHMWNSAVQGDTVKVTALGDMTVAKVNVEMPHLDDIVQKEPS